MCTVSFFPTDKGFIFTSNRDEKSFRKTLVPQLHDFKNQKLFFPKDSVGKGSWISLNPKKKRLSCLLNGGFEKHTPSPPYIKSRGLIVLESLLENHSSSFINKVNLHKIEPFTLLMVDFIDKITLNELVWNGEQKHIKSLDVNIPHFRSSSTLYNFDWRKKRKSWFNEFLDKKQISSQSVLNFHSSTHKKTGDQSNDLIMKREDKTQTVSISQLVLNDTSLEFNYLDLLADENYHTNFNF